MKKVSNNVSKKLVVITQVAKRTFKSDARIDIRFKINQTIFKNIKAFGGIKQHSGKYLETYYDTTEESFPSQPDKWYFLARQGKWLCTRENQWYLRHFKNLGPRSFKNAYGTATTEQMKRAVYLDTAKEAHGEREVRWDLNLQQDFTNPVKKTLQEDLKNIGIIPYARFQNEITRYALNNHFDLTIEKFDFGYALGKLTTTVREPTPKKYEMVSKELMRIIFKLNLDAMAGQQEGIVSYLGRSRPIHFNDLKKIGAIEIPTLEEKLEYGRRIRAMQKIKHIKFYGQEVTDDINDVTNDELLNMTDSEIREKLGDDVYEAINQEINDEWKRQEDSSIEKKIHDLLTKSPTIEDLEVAIENLTASKEDNLLVTEDKETKILNDLKDEDDEFEEELLTKKFDEKGHEKQLHQRLKTEREKLEFEELQDFVDGADQKKEEEKNQ